MCEYKILAPADKKHHGKKRIADVVLCGPECVNSPDPLEKEYPKGEYTFSEWGPLYKGKQDQDGNKKN